MHQIICIGSSAKDIFFPTSEGVFLDTPEDITSQKKLAFELGAKYHIDTRFESLGGCAVNVACGLKRLGVKSSCYTVLGDDMVGDWIREGLEKEEIGTDLIKKEKCLTGLSAIVVDSRNGERIIFSNQEANKYLKVDSAQISDFPWISVTDPNGDWRGVLQTVLDVADKTRAKISFNPRGRNIVEDVEKVYEFASKAEIVFLNKDEAIEIITKINKDKHNSDEINDEVFLLNELKKTGAGVVVITDGSRGAWGFDGKEIIHADILTVRAVDSTGAGDAFSSGFLAGYIKGNNLSECLKMGIVNGASVVLHYGGIDGLLTEESMVEFLDKIEIQKLS